MKRGRWAVAALLLTGLLALPVMGAFDPNYIGPLDPVSGLPAETDSGSSALDTANRVALDSGAVYDRSLGVFVYSLRNSAAEIYADVHDGMIVSTPVSVTASDGVTPQVYYNGSLLEDADPTHLTAAGSYSIVARSGDATQQVLTFTIVGQSANLPGVYNMPSGFYITDATLDGEAAMYNRGRVELSQEGEYHIEYTCPATGIDYTLDVTVDRTPPQLTFDGRFDDKGRAHSAVDVSGFQEGDRVRMTLNGEAARFPTDGHLADSGRYSIEAFDAAGNSSLYDLTILVYFDLNSLIFFTLVVVSVAVVVGYIVYKSKKLKVA